ncbi:MAG TPA: AMP-binding protein, partial [Acidimicrobiales bacterium]|nr:AMP-binding protein [Acidimicrobiales bacterium]
MTPGAGPDGRLHRQSLADVLSGHCGGRPATTAVVCGDERFTWAQLNERVDRLARALVGCGVQPGDRLLWMGQNCHRLLEGLLA